MTFDFKRVALALTAGSLMFGCELTVSALDVTQLAWAATAARTISVGSFPEGIPSDGTHVWVANYGDGTITELMAKTGALVQTIAAVSEPFAISSDGTHVWSVNEGANTVTELKASSGAFIATFAVGSLPAGVSSDGTHVWVANEDANSVTELAAKPAHHHREAFRLIIRVRPSVLQIPSVLQMGMTWT